MFVLFSSVLLDNGIGLIPKRWNVLYVTEQINKFDKRPVNCGLYCFDSFSTPSIIEVIPAEEK